MITRQHFTTGRPNKKEEIVKGERPGEGECLDLCEQQQYLFNVWGVKAVLDSSIKIFDSARLKTSIKITLKYQDITYKMSRESVFCALCSMNTGIVLCCTILTVLHGGRTSEDLLKKISNHDIFDFSQLSKFNQVISAKLCWYPLLINHLKSGHPCQPV